MEKLLKALQKLNKQIKSVFVEEEKPFANEHACRLEDPEKFDKFRRQNNAAKSNGKRLDFIFGIKGIKSKIQSIRYPKKEWGESAARNHCKEKGGSFEAAKKE